MRLELESGNDILRLDGYEVNSRGVQVRAGATGLGLPPKQVHYLEGAGDGALARGHRVLPRDIDLPLYIAGTDREDLKYWLARLGRILGYEHDHFSLLEKPSLWLHFYDDDETKWSIAVDHVGGGDFVYGVDTRGSRDLTTVITLRAANPYFIRNFADTSFLYETGV